MKSSIAMVVAVLLAVLSLFAGCATPPEETEEEVAETGPAGEAYVATEVASLPGAGSFTYDVDTFTTARAVAGSRLASSLVEMSVADRSDDSNRIGVSDTAFGVEGPASASTLGAGSYAVLNGAARISLSRTGTVLGAHVSMSLLGAREHQSLYAGTAMTARFTGRSSDGSWTPAIRMDIASYDGRDLYLTTRWTWIDLSELGPITELLVTIESPLAGERGIEPIATALLIDNLTISSNYRSDTQYISLGVVPGIGTYESAPAILDSQLNFLDTARSNERMAFVSFIGGLVSDPDDEEQWQSVGEALLQLSTEMPFGVSLAPTDYTDANGAGAVSPLFLEALPSDRLSDKAWWGDRSEDELSSWQLVDADLGEFMFLHLAVDTPLETLKWAGEVIDAHPHTPVIVVLDRYMTASGRYHDTAFPVVLEAVAPDEFFTSFVRANPEIFLIVCSDRDDRVQSSRHRTGTPIIELSVATQPTARQNEGYLRLLRFYTDRHELRVVTFSPWLGEYWYDPERALVIPFDFENTIP